MAAVELGKHYGARVIGTGGRDDKLAVVKSRGADAGINYSLADGSLGGFRHKVKEITGIGGADVIYDPVGGDVFDESMRCVNWCGSRAWVRKSCRSRKNHCPRHRCTPCTRHRERHS